jgi:hypothetical protein
MQVTPMPSPSAHIHEAICAWSAPTACAAWNTITAELAKPTSTVMKPATMAGIERSRHHVRAPACSLPLSTVHPCIDRVAALTAQRAGNAAVIFERTSCVMSRCFCHHLQKALTKSAGSLEFAPLLQRIASSETAREQRRHHRRTMIERRC